MQQLGREVLQRAISRGIPQPLQSQHPCRLHHSAGILPPCNFRTDSHLPETVLDVQGIPPYVPASSARKDNQYPIKYGLVR